MKPIFKFKSLVKSKTLINFSATIVFVLAFLLIFFNKSDYLVVNKFKSISNEYINPLTKIVSFPIIFSSNVINEIRQYRIINNENLQLKEEILRLKKWQILALQNSRENNWE